MQLSLHQKLDMEALVRFCRKHGIRELSFFGSVIRDDFGPESDVDVLVEFECDRRVSLLDHVRVERELSELLGRKVDLVTKGALRGRIGETILNTRQVAYVAHQG